MHATLPLLRQRSFPAIRRKRLETVQANLGYRCNQSCTHCHVNAGPTRTEEMSAATMESLLRWVSASGAATLDITGGAPELHPGFRNLVRRARRMGVRVIDRCNLTILEEPGQEDLAAFLAAEGVEVVASLPCYTMELVDRQRGKGVFGKSIAGLRRLNAAGYAMPGSALALNLVYNPQGASLPPPQAALEAEYRKVLAQQHGIRFNRLYALANMPIARFGSALISRGEFNSYMSLLHESYQEANLDSVMCRSLVSVDWRGLVYDCDFNQMLELPLRAGGRASVHLDDLLGGRAEPRGLEGNPVAVADHCYGCTAGQGSSCGGALG